MSKVTLLLIIYIFVVITSSVLVWQIGCIPRIQKKIPGQNISSNEKKELNKSGIAQIEIPSLLNPDEVMAGFAPYMPPWGEEIRDGSPFWKDDFGISGPNKGFLEGFSTSWHGEALYIKEDGSEVKGPADPYGFILFAAVVKYENAESAKEDYKRMSASQEYENFILGGVGIKIKAGLPPEMRIWLEENRSELGLREDQCQGYLLQADNFIIYAYGLKEAAEDVILRAIDKYKVE